MTFRELWRPARVAFEGEGAGAGAGAGAGGGGEDTQPGGGADTQPGGGGADTQPGGGTGTKWWEGSDYTAEERAWLEARGLADEDATKILPKLVKGHRNAEQRLGRPADHILDRPKDGQKVTDWMRENAELFGLPKSAEEVKIEKPKDLKEGIAWDAELETQAKKTAFELGLSNAQLQGMTELYAKRVEAMDNKAETDAAEANERLMSKLQTDWGAETDAKIARARQAVGVVAQAAGLDPAGIEAVSQVLSAKTGDAATIRLFAALGDMIAEDKMVGGGGGPIGMTPADARAKAAQMRQPGGAFFEASQKGDQRKIAELMPELTRLDRIAAGGKA
jgi:hypothetical protein